MGNKHNLKAGAASAVVKITPDLLPLDGFAEVKDDLHVRTIVLESDIRAAIVSVEITSLFTDTQEKMIDIVCEKTGADRDHVWLTLTHSFGGPHIWPAPKPGEPDGPRPGHKPRSEDEIRRCVMLEDAYFAAVTESAEKAASNMRDAVCGPGQGICNVNASRNVETKDGWWLGTNDAEPCDHTVNVLRIDGTDGAPIAAIFTFGVRSCVMQQAKNAEGGGIISSDLCGRASMNLEEEFGNGFTALFLCSSAADQEPLLKANYSEVTKDGELRSVSFPHPEVLLDSQARLLSSQVLNIMSHITETSDIEHILTAKGSFTCATKQMNRNLSALRPAREMEFVQDGEQTQDIFAMVIGKFNLVGVNPEIDGAAASAISAFVPGEVTASAIQVNGGGKCMPCMDAYDNVKYQCINSPYMPGSAEKMIDAARELLLSLK